MSRFRAALASHKILIADGATGTTLQKAGLPAGTAPERWNLENPDAVRALHRGYIEAGADMVLTNTFGGTSVRLKREGCRTVLRRSIGLRQRSRVRSRANRSWWWATLAPPAR